MILLLLTLLSIINISIGNNQINNEQEYELYVYSYATDINQAKRFQDSCKAHDINVTLDGIGKHWNGWEDKINGITTYLQQIESKHNNNTKNIIVMYADSYDVVITCNESEIIQRFKSFKSDIVFQGDSYPFPDPNVAKYFQQIHLKHKSNNYDKHKESDKIYLNAGTFIGDLKWIKQMINSLKSNILYYDNKKQLGCNDYTGNKFKTFDDQRCFATYFLLNNINKQIDSDLNIVLDYNQYIFTNLDSNNDESQQFEIVNGSYNVYRNENKICLLHGNGPHGRLVLDNIFSNNTQNKVKDKLDDIVYNDYILMSMDWINHFWEMVSSVDLRRNACNTLSFVMQC